MKGVDDPEFLLLEKAREVKKRNSDPEAIDELIQLAERIVTQNFKGALMYVMTALETVNTDEMEEMIKFMKETKKKK